ncbi:hypothetical protein ACKKBF_B08660 [Auxenochlorella protothecoides x Auxenochlorella symbiontica]
MDTSVASHASTSHCQGRNAAGLQPARALYPATSTPSLQHSSSTLLPSHHRRDLPAENKIHKTIGIDPERIQMVIAVDEHANTLACTSKEFYARANHRQREKPAARWHA